MDFPEQILDERNINAFLDFGLLDENARAKEKIRPITSKPTLVSFRSPPQPVNRGGIP